MVEGILIGTMSRDIIDNYILPENEFQDPHEGIIELNKWAIPHWDWVQCAKVGAVKVSKITAEYIIERLRHILINRDKDVMMIWLNYGWSIKEDLPDWKCQINFHKIKYKE